MANLITSCRILLSLLLLFFPTLSPGFYGLYLAAGLSDMLDGYVARRTNSASPLGAKLDSMADLVFLAVCLIKLLPVLALPVWLWVWVGLIALLRLVNILSGFVCRKKLVLLHTRANKLTGALLFLLPLSLGFLDISCAAPSAPWPASPPSRRGTLSEPGERYHEQIPAPVGAHSNHKR